MRKKVLFGILFFVLLVFSSSLVLATSDPSDYLTRLYTFEEGSGTKFYDSLNNTNFTNSAMTWQTGLEGTYSGQTTSDSQVAYDQDFTLTGDFSISFWVYPISVGGYYTILAFHDGVNNDNNRFWIDSDDSTYFKVMHDSSGGNDKTISTSKLSSALHNIIITADQGGYMNLWIDGSHIGNTTIGTLSGITCQHLGINSQLCQTSDNKAGWGKIDQLAYFNVILNQSQINYLYNSGTPNDLLTGVSETPITPTENFEITANNYYDGSSINSFNVNINNVTLSTTTGSININSSTDLVDNIKLSHYDTNYSKNGTYYKFNGSQYLEIQNAEAPNLDNYTFIIKFKTDIVGKQQLYDHKYNYALDKGFTLKTQSSNNLQLCNSKDCFVTTNTLNTGQTYCVSASYDGTTGKIYIDGTLSESAALPRKDEHTTNVFIGASSTSSNYFEGNIYSVKVYDTALSPTEINNACDSSTIYDTETFDKENLVYYNPFGVEEQINFSVSSLNYFTNFYYNEYSWSNFDSSLWQSELSLNPTEIKTNNSIVGGYFQVGNFTYNNGETMYLNAGYHNITFIHPDYYPKTQEFYVESLTSSEDNLTDIFNAYLEVRAFDSNSSDIINNLNVALDGYDYSTSNSTLKIAWLLNETEELAFYGSIYSYLYENYTFSSNYTYLNISLTQSGTIKLSIYNESNGLAINNADVEITNDNGAYSYSANLGATNNVYLFVNETGNYTISVSANGYSSRTYYEVLNNGRYVETDVYLIKETETSEITFTIYNEVRQVISDAQVVFYTLINGTLERVAMKTSDYSGQAQINLDSSQTYLIRVTHDDYLQKEVTLNPTSSSYSVILTGTILDYTNLFDGIDYNIAPSGTRGLTGNTSYDFYISISSAENSLDFWGVTLSYIDDDGNLITYTDNKTITTGGISTITLTTPMNSTQINVTYFFKHMDYDVWEKYVEFSVYPAITSSNSIGSAFENYGNGLSDFFKILIATFVTLGLVAMTSRYISFNSYLLGLEILLIFGIFTYYGWVPLWIYLIQLVPTLLFIFLKGGDN